jgi:hypothetical protein
MGFADSVVLVTLVERGARFMLLSSISSPFLHPAPTPAPIGHLRQHFFLSLMRATMAQKRAALHSVFPSVSSYRAARRRPIEGRSAPAAVRPSPVGFQGLLQFFVG